MKSTNTPTVSIGVPVFNGEQTLAAALDSLLAQTYEDFEVIVCDNASTDDTQAICEEYASRDARIRYHRFDTNTGAAPNFHRTFELSRGKYFKWHAADDLVRPTYLEACIVPLEDDPDIVLTYPGRECIWYNGEPTNGDPFLVDYRQLPENEMDDISLTDILRLFPSRITIFVFGLVRSSVLGKIAPMGAFPGSDVSLVYELRLHGRFAQVPGPLYVQRLHPLEDRILTRMTKKGNALWYGSEGGLAARHPEAKLFLECLWAQRRAARVRREATGPIGLRRNLRELLAIRAHVEIRSVRLLDKRVKGAKRSLFGRWSKLSESFLAPGAPNVAALRVWRGGAAAAHGDFHRARAVLLAEDPDELIEEGLGRLLERASVESLSILTEWLQSSDPEKAHLAVRAYTRAAPQMKARLLRHLDAVGVPEVRVRLAVASPA